MRRFGIALVGLVLLPSASEIAARRVGLRAHGFRFSARTASGLPLGGLVLPPSVSAFAARWVGLRAHRFGVAARRVGASAFRFGVAAGRVDLRAHGFRFLARAASELPLGGLVLLPSASGLSSAGWPSDSPLPLFGTHRFGVALGELVLLPSASEMAARRVGLRVHDFRFSACTASGLPSASWFFRLPFRRLPLGGLTFGLTASAFRHAPIRTAAPPT